MSTTPPTVSFIVRRPTPVSRQSSSGPESDREPPFKVPALPRHLSGRSTPQSPLVKETSSKGGRTFSKYDDSSDEEEEVVDEIVTGFDKFGVQRLHEKKKEGPLIIPALANRDWRDARKRKASEIFVPDSTLAATGADGSVGGLGTRDSINSGPQAVGLIKAEKRVKMEVDDDPQTLIVAETVEKEETDDERAMRALIAKANGEDMGDGGLTIDAIPLTGNKPSGPLSEADAYKQDVETRPNSASLDDYERVPVSEFGAALLRGMGWKPGQAASRTRTGPVEPYAPTSRPALLGIGAKEREVVDDGSALGKNGKPRGASRPDKKYVPVVKRERERGSSSAPSSRRASRSPSPARRRERDRDRDRDGGKDRDREYERRRDKDREYSSDDDRERKRDKRRDYESDRDRRRDDRDHDKRNGGERDRDRKR